MIYTPTSKWSLFSKKKKKDFHNLFYNLTYYLLSPKDWIYKHFSCTWDTKH